MIAALKNEFKIREGVSVRQIMKSISVGIKGAKGVGLNELRVMYLTLDNYEPSWLGFKFKLVGIARRIFEGCQRIGLKPLITYSSASGHPDFLWVRW